MFEYVKYGISGIALLMMLLGAVVMLSNDAGDGREDILGPIFFCSGFIAICVIWF